MATRKMGRDTPPVDPEVRDEINEQPGPGTAADRSRPSRPNRGQQTTDDEEPEEEGSISNRGDEYMKEEDE